MNVDGLTDVNVLEVGTTVVAPYTTQLLGALGADVVKVEPPGGDPFRSSGASTDGDVSGYFAMCNCGKRSLRLDLKRPEGTEAFLELAEAADVVVENFRPGVVDRLGIGYDDVRSVAEDVVYCSISGYGQEGPWSDYPGFDPVIQGETGLMSVTGERGGPPVRIGVAVIDLATALWSTVAVTNAIRARDRTGEGAYLDMSMFDVGVSMLTKRASQYLRTGENPDRMGTEDTWSVPYGAYPTADDELLMVAAGRQSLWERLCELIGEEQLLDDDRFESKRSRVAHREELRPLLEATFREERREVWLDLLRGEIPVSPVASVGEALTSEHSDDHGVTTAVEHPAYGTVDVLNLPLRTDGESHVFDAAPPVLGEHSEEVLAEAGVGRDRIRALKSRGVI